MKEGRDRWRVGGGVGQILGTGGRERGSIIKISRARHLTGQKFRFHSISLKSARVIKGYLKRVLFACNKHRLAAHNSPRSSKGKKLR
jgi:hypothetical protein